MKNISKKGIDLIKEFEGEELTAYLCPAGVWTIGVGHTGDDVKSGLTISAAQSEALLRKDLTRFEKGVSRLVKVPLTQHQFDALVSFAFNLGLGALGRSTLLRLLNAGDYEGAADQFKRWNKAGGRVLAGLVRRRAAEAALFRS
jgi:lysozyme